MFGFGEKIFRAGNEGEFEENNQRQLIATREASRAWSGRIMTLSSVIIAFSVSVVSIQGFEIEVDIEELTLSWMFFLGALVLGAFNLLFESRVAYASTLVTKELRIKGADSVSITERLMALLLLFIILFYPTLSLRNSRIPSSKAYLLVENWLHSIFGIVFIFEFITFALFVSGLVIFLNSFQI